VLEVQANLWAMHRMGDTGLADLTALQDEISNLRERATNREIVALDVKFHQLIYRATKNIQLATMLNRMLSHYLRFWLSSPNLINQDTFFKEELDIIQAIASKDEVRLKTATTAHIKASLDEIMGLS
jgi:DNA-binding GntR family transcriptional regulator